MPAPSAAANMLHLLRVARLRFRGLGFTILRSKVQGLSLGFSVWGFRVWGLGWRTELFMHVFLDQVDAIIAPLS